MSERSGVYRQVAVGTGAVGLTGALATVIQLFMFVAFDFSINNDQAMDMAVLIYPFFHYALLRLGLAPNGVSTPEVKS